MALKEFPAGTQLIQDEQNLTALHVIAKGSVCASYPGGTFYLKKGDVIGVCELFYGSHFISYETEDATSIASYPCTAAQLSLLFEKSVDLANMIVSSLFRQFREIHDLYELTRFDCDNLYHFLLDHYEEYKSVCVKHKITPRALPDMDDLTPIVIEDDLEGWLGGYYEQLTTMVTEKSAKFHKADFLAGVVLKADQDIYRIISLCRLFFDYKSEVAKLLMNENRLDLFDLYTGVLYKIDSNDPDSVSLTATLSTMMIQLEDLPGIDKDMYQQRVTEYREKLVKLGEHTEEETATVDDVPDVEHSMDTILSYSEVSSETAAAFRDAVNKFAKMTDKNASDDAARKLRLSISKLFYQIYEQAFLKSLQDPASVPKVVKMFFNFGYVDENLAGLENAAYLYKIVDKLPTDPKRKVYTAYEWFTAIYQGKKSPSRNEFDSDFATFLREQKMSGNITAADEARMVNDPKEQVLFEIRNMFPSVNKITFGRVLSFCPVFSEHNVLKDLDASLVSVDKVETAFKQVREIDFSAYYRDVIYTNPEIGIGKESVGVEVLPDIILMPNMGTRGIAWQEIEGRKRTTPARMMVSIFQMEDLTNILVRLTGDFRWEMCKRVQGARWNDISEPSLTSEYFDYIQFYRKNRDLSADAKDKIKLSMQKAKNSYKEMFIRDYEAWILYEGAGSPRLNKVSRGIIFTYCPFSKEIRTRLTANPLYKDTMARYDVKLAQKLHHFDNIFQKLKNTGTPIPKELQDQYDYLRM
ncbi:MAG: hypothetical protein NC302_13210 [Bacteroidales bacterium]|nr:hypothetical protein [Bacteroidales bacterium]MCM1417047.1 hypothetical protein [bacterium]MCM1423245.1 hypothetical protein [bacterium]